MKFCDKTVWITGASSGIGRALALKIAEDGGRLLLSSRSEGQLAEVARAAEAFNSECIVELLDLSDCDRAAEEAVSIASQYGPIDAVVHAAGISQKGEIEQNKLRVYRNVMEINYFGLVAIVKAVLPGMLVNGNGLIVAISSLAGKIGSKNRSGYSASKFAVCGFMDCLRAEVTSRGVDCITVCPGYVKTNIAHNSLNADGSARRQSTPQIEGGMQPERCADRILKAIHRREHEVIIAQGINAWGPLANRIAPALLRRFLVGRNI